MYFSLSTHKLFIYFYFVACPKCTHNRCTENGECCHDYCLGGCTGLSSGNCFACKKVFLENTNQCVTKCPDNYYMVR